MDFGWEQWQLEVIDDYIMGYTHFDNQTNLADHLHKNINSVKIKLNRRRKELSDMKRVITKEEYLMFLANRFSKTTEEIVGLIGNVSLEFFVENLDELDCLECKEYLLDNFDKRQMSNDEYEIFLKLYQIKMLNKVEIAHILNRSIIFVEELINELERI